MKREERTDLKILFGERPNSANSRTARREKIIQKIKFPQKIIDEINKKTIGADLESAWVEKSSYTKIFTKKTCGQKICHFFKELGKSLCCLQAWIQCCKNEKELFSHTDDKATFKFTQKTLVSYVPSIEDHHQPEQHKDTQLSGFAQPQHWDFPFYK